MYVTVSPRVFLLSLTTFFLDKHLGCSKDTKYKIMKRVEPTMPTTRLLSDVEEISVSKEVGTAFSEKCSVDEKQLVHESQQSEADLSTLMSDTLWCSLYPSLRSLARYLVCTSPLPYWHGQEDDLVEDIVQETIRRVIERAHKAERGEAAPIQSFKQMATVVAYNYYRDLKRHDYRLSRLDPISSPTQHTDEQLDEDALTIAAEQVDQDHLFDILASEIGHFPTKQKQAILTDLANRMFFDKEPTSLQNPFSKLELNFAIIVNRCQMIQESVAAMSLSVVRHTNVLHVFTALTNIPK